MTISVSGTSITFPDATIQTTAYQGGGGGGSVSSFSAGTTGLLPSSPNTGAIQLSGVLNVTNGGTGSSGTPTNGQLLIGNNTSGFSLGTLTAGANVTITNAAGQITIAATGGGGGGGVSSVTGSGNIASSGGATPNITLTGQIPIANGGTGSATQNFVDLSTSQGIAGNKTFTGTTTFSGSSSNFTNNCAFNGTNNFNGLVTISSIYIGSTVGTTAMGLAPSSINFYSPVVGSSLNTSMFFGASSSALGGQGFSFAFNNPSGNTPTVAYNFYGDGTAQKTGGGNWSDVSDSRLKDNVSNLTGSLALLNRLRPVSYTWKIESQSPTVGFIAQEVQQVLSNAVTAHKPSDIQAPLIPDNEVLSVGWQADMTAYLVGAIQELSAKVTALEARVGP